MLNTNCLEEETFMSSRSRAQHRDDPISVGPPRLGFLSAEENDPKRSTKQKLESLASPLHYSFHEHD
ncbi:hypothetical protein D5086_020945 [Populus alba]|uniref:Uncharacterized protein n=1 Tax=Populus alba TaxID=43335 RepID=A0ACC4BN67_POPAL